MTFDEEMEVHKEWKQKHEELLLPIKQEYLNEITRIKDSDMGISKISKSIKEMSEQFLEIESILFNWTMKKMRDVDPRMK